MFKTPNRPKRNKIKARTPSGQPLSISVEDIRNFFSRELSPKGSQFHRNIGHAFKSSSRLKHPTIMPDGVKQTVHLRDPLQRKETQKAEVTTRSDSVNWEKHQRLSISTTKKQNIKHENGRSRPSVWRSGK